MDQQSPFLEAKKNPNHEGRDFYDEEVLEEFNPGFFDIDDVNEVLKMFK